MRLVLICEEASRWSLVIPKASPTCQQKKILISKELSYPEAITSINQISWLVNRAVRLVGFKMNCVACLIVTEIYALSPFVGKYILLLTSELGSCMARKTLTSDPVY